MPAWTNWSWNNALPLKRADNLATQLRIFRDQEPIMRCGQGHCNWSRNKVPAYLAGIVIRCHKSKSQRMWPTRLIHEHKVHEVAISLFSKLPKCSQAAVRHYVDTCCFLIYGRLRATLPGNHFCQLVPYHKMEVGRFRKGLSGVTRRDLTLVGQFRTCLRQFSHQLFH
jgi:hypothetical protein